MVSTCWWEPDVPAGLGLTQALFAVRLPKQLGKLPDCSRREGRRQTLPPSTAPLGSVGTSREASLLLPTVRGLCYRALGWYF